MFEYGQCCQPDGLVHAAHAHYEALDQLLLVVADKDVVAAEHLVVVTEGVGLGVVGRGCHMGANLNK